MHAPAARLAPVHVVILRFQQEVLLSGSERAVVTCVLLPSGRRLLAGLGFVVLECDCSFLPFDRLRLVSGTEDVGGEGKIFKQSSGERKSFVSWRPNP